MQLQQHNILDRDAVENNFDDEVIDPYYGGTEGFEEVFNLIEKAVNNLILIK